MSELIINMLADIAERCPYRSDVLQLPTPGEARFQGQRSSPYGERSLQVATYVVVAL